MSPLTRTWAISAALVAVLLASRGLWPLALAVFLLSPAPAWAFAGRSADSARASASWMRTIGLVAAGVALAYVAAIAMGGLPPVHEWRGLLSGTR
ncbi:MAG TPA: hypothetical protein PLM09_05225 [Casimicrobiaceae bacterium]|nr:hypothetical protein [Casimicrobiaceae bacterium]